MNIFESFISISLYTNSVASFYHFIELLFLYIYCTVYISLPIFLFAVDTLKVVTSLSILL